MFQQATALSFCLYWQEPPSCINQGRATTKIIGGQVESEKVGGPYTPSEARRIRGSEAPEKKTGGPGVLPRKISMNGMQMVQI